MVGRGLVFGANFFLLGAIASPLAGVDAEGASRLGETAPLTRLRANAASRSPLQQWLSGLVNIPLPDM